MNSRRIMMTMVFINTDDGVEVPNEAPRSVGNKREKLAQ